MSFSSTLTRQMAGSCRTESWQGFLGSSVRADPDKTCTIIKPDMKEKLLLLCIGPKLSRGKGVINVSIVVLIIGFGGDPVGICLNDQAIKA